MIRHAFSFTGFSCIMNGRKYVHMKYYYEMVSKDSQSVSRKPYTYILGGVYMAKLDGFMALLTGSFNNREQYDALQKAC